jgi:ferritin
MTENMAKEINKQINAEFFSSYLYLSMAAYFEGKGFGGFAMWMRSQAVEESGHAMIFFNYLRDRGADIVLDAIEKPKSEWKNALDVFKDALAHEKLVTSKINNLADIAQKEKDHATFNMLQWFIAEQVEEEANAQDIVDKLTLIGDNANGLFMMDSKLGKRAIKLPASFSGEGTE